MTWTPQTFQTGTRTRLVGLWRMHAGQHEFSASWSRTWLRGFLYLAGMRKELRYALEPSRTEIVGHFNARLQKKGSANVWTTDF